MMLFLPKYSSTVGSSRLRMYIYSEDLGPYLLSGKFKCKHLPEFTHKAELIHCSSNVLNLLNLISGGGVSLRGPLFNPPGV